MSIYETKARDGKVYDIDSPEVVEFKRIYPEVTDEVATNTVKTIRETLLDKQEPANPGNNHDAAVLINKIRAEVDALEAPAEENEPAEAPAEEAPAEVVAEKPADDADLATQAPSEEKASDEDIA